MSVDKLGLDIDKGHDAYRVVMQYSGNNINKRTSEATYNYFPWDEYRRFYRNAFKENFDWREPFNWNGLSQCSAFYRNTFYRNTKGMLLSETSDRISSFLSGIASANYPHFRTGQFEDEFSRHITPEVFYVKHPEKQSCLTLSLKFYSKIRFERRVFESLGFKYTWDMLNIEFSNTRQRLEIGDDFGHIRMQSTKNELLDIDSGVSLDFIKLNTSENTSWNINFNAGASYPIDFHTRDEGVRFSWGVFVFYNREF